jgi:hypothetical protein
VVSGGSSTTAADDAKRRDREPLCDIRAAVVVAAIVSGGAAILATYGLMFGFESHPPLVVITRKWLGSIVALALLFAATAAGLVAATLSLF